MSLMFPETSAATADELTLSGDLMGADIAPVRLLLLTQTEMVEMARDRVRKFEIAEWSVLVGRFVERVSALDPNAEIWVDEGERLVTVVTPRDELDHELALHASFVDLSRSVHDPTIANLTVRTPADAQRTGFGQRVA
jgi:hypothetical protein